MLFLETLDLGMSDQKEALQESVITPTPPLDCRVGTECKFTLSTRTSAGLLLPHGGLSVAVRTAQQSAAEASICSDGMNGAYLCVFPTASVAVKGEFDFLVSADGQDFEPIRTLRDPTTGVESTVATCECDGSSIRLSVFAVVGWPHLANVNVRFFRLVAGRCRRLDSMQSRPLAPGNGWIGLHLRGGVLPARVRRRPVVVRAVPARRAARCQR
eukprot:SAG22_NODE_82_length_21749_cov_10.719769_10_plen_214_part_00